MSDYGSGDELLDDINPEDLLKAGSKRVNLAHDDGDQRPDKRVKQGPTTGEYDFIARSVLKRNFNYDDFRHEQVAAIRAIFQGENALVVFPTGAGKSLCYQIPGIAFEELDAAGLTERQSKTASIASGITIVVSPLIALMKDQVDALQRRGISAACLDSTKTFDEQKSINLSMQEGRLRILYCAPERLNNEGFVESMKFVPGGIRLVAVDEAHCISEWGHSFRPDYLKVARFVNEIKAERVICLTATATPRVAEDVRKAFNIKESNVFRTSPYRPNLQLHAEVVPTKKDKFPRLLKFLKTHDGPTLVYVTTQKQTEELVSKLSREGHDASAFHAGLPVDKKSQTQDAFMAGKTRIVVATIAFGMGIDKADIRNILHYDISSTIEEYSQQVGRAGRDGKQSFCMIYLCRDDFWLRENFVRGDLPSWQSLQELLEDIFLHQPRAKLPGGGEVIKLSQLSLGNEHDIRSNPLGIILATIELRFGLIRAVTPEYSVYQFEAGPGYDTRIRLDKSPEAKAILNHSKKARKLYTIDVNATAKADGLLRNDIIRKLNQLNDKSVLRLKVSGVVNRYKVLQELPSTSEEIKKITDKLHPEMENREKDAMKRFQAVCDLLTDSQCFAQALSGYFGMDLPDGKSKCGHCTYCLTGKPIVLPPKPNASVDLEGIRNILDECDVRDDPRFLARVAFGIKSPRVGKLKLDKKNIFGSLEDHDFESLLKEFHKACESAGYRSK
ncbi:putative ATP-dependent DNA helicase recQ [Rosellinia necatrix]|uniref:ATP-dependent DNA helicase n=1 Tax=Rosellinia necatrix TaxID=77044 RepID=A0A1S8A7P4_ROSNE|nr:putative ATP-dependent DNA helicase recQ [Rosellinia necatrix]